MANNLRDPRLEEELRTRGYGVAPIGDETVVPRLTELFESLRSGDLKSGFRADVFSRNFTYRKAVLHGVREILAGVVERFFDDHRVALANFAVKEPANPHSALYVHQDWTILEPPLRQMHFYVPLCNQSPRNGCVYVLPGSHRSDRPCLIPSRELALGDELREEIHQHYLVPVPLTVGQGMVFDGYLLHGSPPNLTPERRVAIIAVVVPRRAALRINYFTPQSKTNQVEIREVDDSYFTDLDMSAPTKGGTLVRYEDVPQRPITRDEVRSWYSCLGSEAQTRGAPDPESAWLDVPYPSGPRAQRVSPYGYGGAREGGHLREDRLGTELRERGYCVAPLGDETILSRLLQLYQSLSCDLRTGFHADMHSRNFAYRKAVLEGVRDILSGFLPRFFTNHRVALANFVVKEAGAADSAVPLHQDWTVLERPQHHCNVFIPLCDVTPENGCLHVLPGSHVSDRLGLVPSRGLPLDHELLQEIHERYIVPVPMTAGQCLIYDGSLLHCSPPNRSPQRRVAVGMMVVPRDAKLRMGYWPPRSDSDRVEFLDVEDDYFTQLDMSRPEKGGTFVRYEEVPQRPITREEVRSWFACLGSEPPLARR